MDSLSFEEAEKKKKKKKKKKERKNRKNQQQQQLENEGRAMATMETNGSAEGAELASFLSFALASNESQQLQEDTGLIKFTNHLEGVFSGVRRPPQTPWLKLFNELAADTIDRNIPHEVRQLAVSWIQHRSNEALKATVLRALDCIVAGLEGQKAGSGGSNCQVVMFLVVSLILQQKPDVLVSILSIWKDNSRYHGESKLPVFVWMTMQAARGDLTLGLYIWAREMLPLLGMKSNPSPETKELVLQVVESILSVPNAKQVLVSGYVRKGERLLPASALELLLHLAFPSAPVEETDRFETIYPTLRCVAIAGVNGSDSRKQLAIQIQDLAWRAIGGGNAKLSDKATGLFVLSLYHNPECYKRWDRVYEDDVDKSVAILRKLKKLWVYLAPYEDLVDTLKRFRQKNEKVVLSGGKGGARRQAMFIEADEHCKELLRMVSPGWRLQAVDILKSFVWYGCTIFFIILCCKSLPLDEVAWKMKS
ncbi:transmembrane protein 214-like [Coffea eugenioides]|uniref:transmembrane protein 214-like n=1 Tax=Coffea eugenioides TaxID=49369 RepID=UPI000F614817|nr:transmembrane protein 214-like [Coffea eugenioides]